MEALKLKKLIIVAGMHRSGTSAYTGAIEKLGVKLGRNLATGHVGINDKGYKEDIDIIGLHDELLWAHRSAWNDIFPLPSVATDPNTLERAKSRIREILREYFKSDHLCGLKEPRICLFLPLWLEVAEEEGIDVSFILPFRDPFSVAKSLEKRDGLSFETSLILWVKYLLNAEKYSRGKKRVFVSYENLIADSSSALGAIVDQLEIPTQGDRTKTLEEGASFISIELNRSTSNEQRPDACYDFALTLYEVLKQADQKDLGSNCLQDIERVWGSYEHYIASWDQRALEQIEIFRNHAATNHKYWMDALGSRSVRMGQAVKSILGLGGKGRK